MTICYMVIWGWGVVLAIGYITQPDFFHRDPTSWAIHECRENKKNGLLTDAGGSRDLLVRGLPNTNFDEAFLFPKWTSFWRHKE